MNFKLPTLPDAARIEAVQFCDDGLYFTPDQMREYAKAAVLAEREACATLCAERYALNAASGFPREASTARRLRDAIRARGTP